MATAETNPAPSNQELSLPDGVTLETDQKCVKIKIRVSREDTDLNPLIDKAVAGLKLTRERLRAISLPAAPIV